MAQGERDYDIEYEIKATKRIVDKFKNKDELKERLENTKIETLNEALDIYHSGIKLYENNKDKQFQRRVQKLLDQFKDYIDWKETNK